MAGAVQFRNKVTNAVRDSIPPTAPGAMSPHVAAQGVEAEEDATAVMPRQRHLIEAGRYDLHHAVLPPGTCHLAVALSPPDQQEGESQHESQY